MSTPGSLRAAEAAYRRADERGSGDGAADLGWQLHERGELAGAEAAFRRSDERGSAEGAFSLGLLREMEDDIEGAAAAYQLAINSGHAEFAPAAKTELRLLRKDKGSAAGQRNNGK